MERFGAARPPGHPGLLHIPSCGEQKGEEGWGVGVGVQTGEWKVGRIRESLSKG